MNFATILAILILSTNIAVASDDLTSELTFITDGKFQDYHDNPARITIAINTDNKTQRAIKVISGNFYNKFVKYEEIYTWEKNERLVISHHKTKGLGVLRKQDGKFYKMFFDIRSDQLHPFHVMKGKCFMEHGQTTISIDMCSSMEAKNWIIEQNYAIEHLVKTLTPEARQHLLQSQKDWLAYTQSNKQLHRTCSTQNLCKGSRHTTGYASLNTKMQIERTQHIMSIYFYMN